MDLGGNSFVTRLPLHKKPRLRISHRKRHSGSGIPEAKLSTLQSLRQLIHIGDELIGSRFQHLLIRPIAPPHADGSEVVEAASAHIESGVPNHDTCASGQVMNLGKVSDQLCLVDEAPIELGSVDLLKVMIQLEVSQDLPCHSPGFSGCHEEPVSLFTKSLEEFAHPGINIGFELTSPVEPLAVELDRSLRSDRIRISEEDLESPSERRSYERSQFGMFSERFAQCLQGIIHARKEARFRVGDRPVEIEEEKGFQNEEKAGRDLSP